MILERGGRLYQRCLARHRVVNCGPRCVGDTHDTGANMVRVPVDLLGRSRSESVEPFRPGRDLIGRQGVVRAQNILMTVATVNKFNGLSSTPLYVTIRQLLDGQVLFFAFRNNLCGSRRMSLPPSHRCS